MDFIKKKYIKQKRYLDKLPILIEDTSNLSEKYFNIIYIPNILTGGKNLITFLGKINSLKPNTKVYVEILDVNNNAVYYEIPVTKGDNNERYIIPFILNNTPIGMGKITLIGTAQYDLNGNNVPLKWANIPNVKWSRYININKEARNNSPILFKDEPKITINRIESSYYPVGLDKITLTDGKIGYEFNKSNNTSYLFSDGFDFTHEMINAIVSISNPQLSNQGQENNNPIPYNTSILNVVNKTTAIAQTRYNIGKPPFAYDFIDRFELSDYSMNYELETQEETTNPFLNKSYIQLGVSNLNLLSGDITRSRLYFKDKNYNSNFELLDDFVYEDLSLLKDYTDINHVVNYGIFDNDNTLNYWTPSYLDNTLLPDTINITRDDTYVLNSIKVESSIIDLNKHILVKQAEPIFFTNNIDYNLNLNLYINDYTNSKLEIYISGSAFITEDNILGKKILDCDLLENFNQNISTLIFPDQSGTGQLIFKLNNNKIWYFGNIIMTSRIDPKHSPQTYMKYIATPIDHLSSSLSFRLEYFNYENVQSISSSVVDLGDSITYIQPTLKLYLDVVDENGIILEYGTIANIDLTSSFQKNDAGNVTSRNIKRENTMLTNQITQDNVYHKDMNVYITDKIKYSTTVNYAEGPVKNNSIGEPFPFGKIPSGTLVDYAYVYGKNKIFAGVSSSYQENKMNNAWIRNPNNYQQDPLLPDTPFTFKIEVTDEDIFTWVISPLNRPVQSIKLVQSSNAEIIGSFDSTVITIKDAAGLNNVEYNLYYEKLVVPNSYLVTYSVFIP